MTRFTPNVRRGYLPDGSGAWYQGRVLEQYAPCRNDDDLLLYLSRALTSVQRTGESPSIDKT